ncbi:hypothetical protein WJX72_011406 [[Myrmecia] bisecta]|uniref:Alpha-carbonic anhydrase domain-containing protein n=1 Tax=[Myrmecia] bisecta TaxID=41462 RepID=A0AAW1QTS7_9CHLO
MRTASGGTSLRLIGRSAGTRGVVPSSVSSISSSSSLVQEVHCSRALRVTTKIAASAGQVSRREVLLGTTALVGATRWSCACCGQASAAAGYGDDWGGTCATGVLQSPIEIRLDQHPADALGQPLTSSMQHLTFEYSECQQAAAVNLGRGLMQVRVPLGNFCLIGTRRLQLLQFHFHSPSEHAFSGQHTSMEAHLVHRDIDTGKLAVLGVLLERGGRDLIKEESRVFYRQTVFTFDDWAFHRSSRRYGRHLGGLLRSKTVQGLAEPLVLVVLDSLSVATYEQLRELGRLPSTWPSLTIGMGEVSVLSFALSLLLVFRTNASYTRWLDARKVWGGLLNRSRDLMRQGATWFPDSDSELTELLQRWITAFPRALKVHLRENEDVAAELQGVLRQHEVAQLLTAEHRPNFVLQDTHPPVVHQAYFPLPGCVDRFPALHTLGRVRIEEPFGILPLESICATAERNIKEIRLASDEARDVVRRRDRPATGNCTKAVG